LVCRALFSTSPAKKVQHIGLYDIVNKLDQDDRFTVFLATHRFIDTQPLTVLKVYHLDVYASAEEKQYRIREIFHSHDAMRILGMHSNLVRCGDMFTRNDDIFVEPVGYVEGAQLLEWMLEKRTEQVLTWGRQNANHQRGGCRPRAGAQARRHSPRCPSPQHRDRPGRSCETRKF
jgi:hypothetical protein